MHAFDYVMTLMSFVYALAIAHLLATVGDIIGAWSRVRFSWFNAAWMTFALFGVLAWWIGLWTLRAIPAWRMDAVGVFFLLAGVLYLEARLVCARIPAEGIVDLGAFHRREGRKYMAVWTALTVLTMAINIGYLGTLTGNFAEVLAKNQAVLAMFVAGLTGTIFSDRRVQLGAVLLNSAAWAWYFGTLQGALS